MLQSNTSKIAPFLDVRIASIFLLGILSGLPWVMIGSSLNLWLKEAGVSRTEIGYAGLIFGVYTLNFFWAPLLDRLQFKRFTKLGSRRTWIALCQCVIVTTCFVMAGFSPEQGAKTIVLLALIIAVASATQDVAIDAFRVNSFSPTEPEKISAAASAATAGWWSGYAGLGFIPLFLSDHGFSWPTLFPLMGCASLLLSTGLFLGRAPKETSSEEFKSRQQNYYLRVTHFALGAKIKLLVLILSPLVIAVWAVAGSVGLPTALSTSPLYVPLVVIIEVSLVIAIMMTLAKTQTLAAPSTGHPQWLNTVPTALLTNVIAPLEDFFKRNGLQLGLTLLAFVVIFKLGEAFLGRMSIVFYKEVGFSNTDIATYSKLVTWGVTVAAAVPCALLNARLGIVKGLFISGIFMAASNLMFAVIAQIGPDINWYLATTIVDGLTTAWGSIAFVAFISMLCSHTFSATQYALLASLGTMGRTTIAAFSGQMVDGLGGNWTAFFIITSLMVIPGLVMLLWLSNRLKHVINQAEV